MLPLLLTLACVRPAPGPELLAEPGPVLLGWRFIPGDVLRLRLETRFAEGAQVLQRQEEWDYMVTEVDPAGGARLRAHLTGLGARVERDGEPVAGEDFEAAREAEKQRLAGHELSMQLTQDGRLVSLEGVEGADALPHRLLALQLSPETVQPGDRWPDPALARPYAELMPVGMDVRVEAYEQLEGLYARGGSVQAHLATEGGVTPTEEQDGPRLRMEGEAWWDLQAGLLVERRLAITLEGLSTGEAGALEMNLSRAR